METPMKRVDVIQTAIEEGAADPSISAAADLAKHIDDLLTAAGYLEASVESEQPVNPQPQDPLNTSESLPESNGLESALGTPDSRRVEDN